MEDKEKSVGTQPEIEDLNTTAPNPRPSEWKMPEPVFRQTSGKLPQGFEKNYAAAVADAAETPQPESDATGGHNADLPNAAIEPQPNNPTVKIVLVLLGLVGMIAFLVVFVTVIYFFFLRSAE